MFNGPKKIKKGKLSKFEFKASKLKFGIVGLKTTESGFLSAKQLEAARQAIARKSKRKSKIWIKIFTGVSVTSKPTGTRMGKGKGSVSGWVARVRGGTVIFEICGTNLKTIISALKTGGTKLPLKTKIFN